MKKLFIATCLTCALSLAAHAAEGEAKKEGEAPKRPALTAEQKAEQKALRKEINDKYDTNKDGKLDKEERAKISEEDKAKLEKAGMGPRKKSSRKNKEAATAEGKKK